ncbi:MAG: ATP-binding cassette domain-containing protein [Acidimicrobiia bacterium]|nr:ATP-binding cassette domain-containing protein [Acidimicrobiia bacterium]
MTKTDTERASTAESTDTVVIRTRRLTKEFAGIPSGPPTGPPGRPPGRPEGTADRDTDGADGEAPHAFRAVDRLDLEVRRGEIYGLLGPNGAGKTTTIGMLTTRVIPTSGSAEVDGVDVVAHPSDTKQVIGVVTQTNTLDRSLTVYENLYYHGRYFGLTAGAARAEATALLEQFRLSERAKTEVASLSGGMAQRLMVARAIMHRPKVLFLDEPTTGLDPQSRLALWEILRELHDAGQTILLTTHYMEEADQLCDRVAIMDHGRILALDTPHGLKQTVEADTLVTITGLGDLEGFAAALASIEGVANTEVDGDQVRLFARGTDGILGRVIETAEKVDATITDVSMTETTLETVFISLTGKDLRE